GFVDNDLRAELSVEPLGTTYSFFGDDLFWQYQNLFEKPGIASQSFTFMDHDHPPLGQGRTLTYTLRVSNKGDSPATNVQALAKAYYALSLPAGVRQDESYMEYQQLDVGTIAAGATVTVTFAGVVEVDNNWRYDRCINVDGEPPEACRELLRWAVLDGLIFDASSPLTGTAGIPTSPPVEWVWADHQVDIEPPDPVRIDANFFTVGPGTNTIPGEAVDPSGVSLVEVEVQEPGGGTTILNCPDATPADGHWSCDWNVSGNEGDEFILRARATDSLGHVSDWSQPEHIVVMDATPPAVTLDEEARAAVNGQIIGPAGALLTGAYADNHSGGRVQACRQTDSGTVCGDATMLLSTQASTGTAYIYDDAPTSPISITSAALCGISPITRTFAVADSFVVGDVDLGFGAWHPSREELIVDLISPSGTRSRVVQPTGALTGFANYDVWLNDAASGPLHVPADDDPTDPAFDRPAQPADPLSAFDGEPSLGVWQLEICDLNPALNEGAYVRSRLSLSERNTDVAMTGTWAYGLPMVAGADGLTQTLNIYGIDRVGNSTAGSFNLVYTLDVVAPAMTTTQALAAFHGLSPTLVLNGQVSDGSGVDELYVQVDPPDAASYRGLSDRSGGDWSYTLQPDVPGTYTLWPEAHDLAGNITTGGPYTVTVTCADADLNATLVDAMTAVGAGSPISLTARVANNGGDDMAPGMSVSFYADDTLIGTALTAHTLGAGDSENVTVSWSGGDPGDHNISVVLNDDGTGHAPLCAQLIENQQTVSILDVPLVQSWNLMSTYVDPFNTDITVVQRPISGTYRVIQSFDQGAQSYYPDLPLGLNTLADMGGEHGYWIRVQSGLSPTLRFVGQALPPDHPLPLTAGWNLVSYLPRVSLPVTQALQSIDGQYTAVLGFEQGALSYYPDLPPGLNTLHSMAPLHGYWIRATGAVTLTYPNSQPLSEISDQLPPGRGTLPIQTDVVSPTNRWVDFYGPAMTTDGVPLPAGTAVLAIDPDGVTCGAAIVRIPGRFGLLPCYGDDPDTAGDEGAMPRDFVRLVVDGVTMGRGLWLGPGERQRIALGQSTSPTQLYLPLLFAATAFNPQTQSPRAPTSPLHRQRLPVRPPEVQP
ncbi:MAG: hypothetical protein GXP41_07975, partial [Chloroflexi bacterium]|nr:hypothetical protein [Chloroflexota bacterium]